MANRSAGYEYIYQSRYKSFPIAKDNHFFQVCRYIERNSLRAGLVNKAKEWRWSSFWIREQGNAEQKKLLSNWPVEMPIGYMEWVDMLEKDEEDRLEKIRYAIKRGRTCGEESWIRETAEKLGLLSTLRAKGGQRKK